MRNLLDLGGEGIREISAAFAWMHVIEDQLRYLGDGGFKVAVHQRNVQRWMRIPLMLPSGWSAGVSDPDQVVTEMQLDQIEALSSFLDGKVLDSDDVRVPDLRVLIDEAGALLTGDSTLDPALASYIRRLLDAIRYALDNEAAGRLFDFTAAVEDLRVAFQAAAESAATDEEKQSWRAMAQQLFVGVVTSLVVEAGKKMLGITP